MKQIVVKLKQNQHANLDSFPFRYGFHSDIDIDIELTNVRKIDDEKIHKPNERYGVSATFTLPDSRHKDLRKVYRGKFIIQKIDNLIVTVIREGSLLKTEHFLSETLKTLRVDGDIDSQDLIDMFKKRIKTHAEVLKHLSNKIGEKKVRQAEDVANEKIEKMSKILQSSIQEAFKKDKHIEYLDGVVIRAELEKDEAIEEAIELKKKLKTSEEKNQVFLDLSKNKEHTVNDKYDISGTDWSKESTTSGVFESCIVQGDYLVVTLHVAAEGGEITREIRCKNTHIGDYEKAVEYVKSLKDGDMITYTTRGVDAYGSGWFYRIEKDSQSESNLRSNAERIPSQSSSPSSGGLNANDSDWGYYDHDTDFDIDENGNIKGKL